MDVMDGNSQQQLKIQTLRKPADEQAPAKNIKKAEVNDLLPHPQGETSGSLEKKRRPLK